MEQYLKNCTGISHLLSSYKFDKHRLVATIESPSMELLSVLHKGLGLHAIDLACQAMKRQNIQNMSQHMEAPSP